jgi:hypothetical protein
MSDATQELRFQVWKKLDNEQTRTLVAAFADYLDALEYAAEYVEGEFTEAEVVSL